MYVVNKLVWFFADPFVLTIIGLLACALFMRRRLWLLCCVIWMWLWSCGALTYWVDKQMAVDYPPLRAEDYPAANAIVELGGGMGAKVKQTGYAEINPAADRVWMAARLWKAGRAPIVIPSGWGCTEADGQLLQDLGVPASAIVADSLARNTEENAKFVAKLLSESQKLETSKPIQTSQTAKPSVLLVTSVWHMKRSLLMFEKYAPDLEVIPVATDYEGRDNMVFNWARLLPSAAGLCANVRTAHELAGYWWYKWIR